MTTKTTTEEHETPAYRAIGKMIREAIERSYGKGFSRCFTEPVLQALIAREAFFIVQGSRAWSSGDDLRHHGMLSFKAGLRACQIFEP